MQYFEHVSIWLSSHVEIEKNERADFFLCAMGEIDAFLLLFSSLLFPHPRRKFL